MTLANRKILTRKPPVFDKVNMYLTKIIQNKIDFKNYYKLAYYNNCKF